MKNSLIPRTGALFIVVALLCGCGAPGAITATCPDAVQYLPGFPPFEDREAFFNDSLLYRRGYDLRRTPRGSQAVLDAGETLDFYLERFGEAMGVTLNVQSSPAIARYVKATYDFARSGIANAKKSYRRQRPFSYFGQPSAIPADEEKYGLYTSYPSGHGIRGWVISLALTAIDDEHQYEILRLGYSLGESRVIAGYHYESDITSARLAAGVGFAKIVSDKNYMKLMKRARKELERLRHKE